MKRTLSLTLVFMLLLSVLPSLPGGSVAYGATIPVVCLGANDATLRINPALAAASAGRGERWRRYFDLARGGQPLRH